MLLLTYTNTTDYLLTTSRVWPLSMTVAGTSLPTYIDIPLLSIVDADWVVHV